MRIYDAKPTSSEKGDVGQHEPSNTYETLDVEEVEDEPIVTFMVKAEGKKTDYSGSSKKSKGKGRSKAEYTYEESFDLKRSFEELYFMLFCFFKDMNDIRQHLSRIVWSRYKEGEMTLMTASVVTDLAIDVKRREQAFLDTEVTLGIETATFERAVDELQKAQAVSAVPLYWSAKEVTIRKMGGRYLGDLLYGFTAGIAPAASTDPLRQYDLAEWLFVPEHLGVEVSTKMGCLVAFLVAHCQRTSRLDTHRVELQGTNLTATSSNIPSLCSLSRPVWHLARA